MKVSEEIFAFLKELGANNNREWFHEHKAQYLAAREAFEDFTADFINLVSEYDPSVGTPEVKNSIYRINRDIRFSNDKTPYKTNFCCFVARGGKKSRLPGYFLSISPSDSMMGNGLYCLDAAELKKVRTEICNFPEEITSIVEDELFRATYRLWDNALKTFPKGYETGFHGDYLLKYKALSAYAELSDDEVLADDFEKRLARRIEIAVPMNAFLTRALEAPDEEKIDF